MPVTPTLAALALAVTVPELDATLARFEARDPVRARFTIAQENVSGSGKDAQRTSGEVAGEVAEGPEGLSVTWPRELLAKAREEERRRATDPEARTPARDGMAATSALDLASMLDAAAALRRDLAGAAVVEEKDEAVDGRPARLVVLKLLPALSTRDRKYVKEVEARMKLWLGPDGVPLAAETNLRASGRAFLVVSFSSEQRAAFRFEAAGDRLVAVRREDERRSEGAGEKGERRSTTTLALVR